MPGEEFSYNQSVGRRTTSAGFREAGAYSGGKVVNSVGGGICQVSSTLYNVVLRANLEVTDRSNHMFAVGYVPIGTDATVSWGAPDFKFKNNRTYPIKIVASTSKRNVYIKIMGLKEENDYEVQIISYRTVTDEFCKNNKTRGVNTNQVFLCYALLQSGFAVKIFDRKIYLWRFIK